MFNVGNLGIDNYCTYHQEDYSNKSCAQWKHNTNAMVVNVIDILTIEDHSRQTQDTYEPALAKKKSNVGNSIFTLDLIINNDQQIIDEPLVGDAPPPQPIKKYNLRGK